MTRLFAFAAILAGASLGLLAPSQSVPTMAAAPQAAGQAAADLHAVAGKLQDNLATVPEIAKAQARVIIVLKSGTDASTPPSHLPLITHRLTAILNSSPLKDKVSFVNNTPPQTSTKPAKTPARPPTTTNSATTRPTTTRAAATRPSRTRGAAATPSPANYTLSIDLHRQAADSPYVLLARLTDAKTGVEIFESSYEVQDPNN